MLKDLDKVIEQIDLNKEGSGFRAGTPVLFYCESKKIRCKTGGRTWKTTYILCNDIRMPSALSTQDFERRAASRKETPNLIYLG